MSHILVIDDDALLREFIMEWLRRAGHEVTALSSGAKADEVLQHARFDLVLTDLYMPSKDGLETISVVKRRAPETPVIVMTASRDDPAMRLMMLLGATALLQKPFQETELEAALQAALSDSHGPGTEAFGLQL